MRGVWYLGLWDGYENLIPKFRKIPRLISGFGIRDGYQNLIKVLFYPYYYFTQFI